MVIKKYLSCLSLLFFTRLFNSKKLELNSIFLKGLNWRSDASKNLMPKLIEYDSALKETIGLRLQSKLTKEQAIYVSRCNSIHRDISLNF